MRVLNQLYLSNQDYNWIDIICQIMKISVFIYKN